MDVVVCVVVVGELRLVKILRGFFFWLSIRRFGEGVGGHGDKVSSGITVIAARGQYLF